MVIPQNMILAVGHWISATNDLLNKVMEVSNTTGLLPLIDGKENKDPVDQEIGRDGLTQIGCAALKKSESPDS